MLLYYEQLAVSLNNSKQQQRLLTSPDCQVKGLLQHVIAKKRSRHATAIFYQLSQQIFILVSAKHRLHRLQTEGKMQT